MDEIAKLSDLERLELFKQTSSKLGIPIAMAEKDDCPDCQSKTNILGQGDYSTS